MLIPIALILVGLALILVEVYLIPGFNVVGILGLLLILFAVGQTFLAVGALGGLLALAGSAGAVVGTFYFLYQSGAWDKFVLSANLKRDDSEVALEREQRIKFVGQSGIAVTPLRPSGVVEINGERLEATTGGEFIAAGSLVRVVAMDRRQFFVRLSESLPEQTTDEGKQS
ncbi:MAG: NfeD family protein [Rhodothermales bacterium]|nr:NfeD family protein [Rhodothermales bacterium]